MKTSNQVGANGIGKRRSKQQQTKPAGKALVPHTRSGHMKMDDAVFELRGAQASAYALLHLVAERVDRENHDGPDVGDQADEMALGINLLCRFTACQLKMAVKKVERHSMGRPA